MREKIFGFFANIDDAKSAIGSIKKENFNQAELTVIFAEDNQNKKANNSANYEFATESFLQSSPDRSIINWPGIKKQKIAGVGEIQIGLNKTIDSFDNTQISIGMNGEDLSIVQQGLKENKVITIIEAEPNILSRAKAVLERHGAEIIT